MFNYEWKCDARFGKNEYNEDRQDDDNQRWMLPIYARLTNRYTLPVNPDACVRENDLHWDDVEDLSPALIPIRDLFPPVATFPTIVIRSGFDTPNDVVDESAPDSITDAMDDVDPDADTVIVSRDDDEDVDVGVIEDVIDLVSDEEDDIPHRPSVICWAGRQ